MGKEEVGKESSREALLYSVTGIRKHPEKLDNDHEVWLHWNYMWSGCCDIAVG